MVVYRSHGIIQIEERWFDKQIEHRQSNADIIMYQNIYQKEENEHIRLIRSSETLITDLNQTVEDIFFSFSKSTKYNIRRAERDGYSTCFFTNPDKLLIKEFCKSYAELYRQKGMKISPPENKLESYILSGNLLISTIGKEDLKNVSYHVYYVDGVHCRSLYSINLFRNHNKDRNELGRANRKHHFDDILFLKEQGYSIYDWGGCREEGDVKSIAEFKKGFGGIKKNTYYYVEPVSMKGKLAAYLLFK